MMRITHMSVESPGSVWGRCFEPLNFKGCTQIFILDVLAYFTKQYHILLFQQSPHWEANVSLLALRYGRESGSLNPPTSVLLYIRFTSLHYGHKPTLCPLRFLWYVSISAASVWTQWRYFDINSIEIRMETSSLVLKGYSWNWILSRATSIPKEVVCDSWSNETGNWKILYSNWSNSERQGFVQICIPINWKNMWPDLWKNGMSRECASRTMCAFSLVPQVQNWCPVFVIFLSKNLSTCRRLWRVNASYQGKRCLHFNLPSLYSCRTRSPLPRALVKIPARGLSRSN